MYGYTYFADQNFLGSRGPIRLKCEVLEMLTSNISKYRAQRVDEENYVICLLARLWFLECQSGSFYVISAEYRKKQTQFGQDLSMQLKGLIWLLWKKLWIREFWATISKLSTFKNTGLYLSFVHPEFLLFFCPVSIRNISQTVTYKTCLNKPLSART